MLLIITVFIWQINVMLCYVMSYDNIHSMTYITKIMLTRIAIRNTGYILKIILKDITRVT